MEDRDRDSSFQRGTVAAGLSVFGVLLTGFAGIFGAFVALMYSAPGSGICLLAAAFAFGLLANAVFRR